MSWLQAWASLLAAAIAAFASIWLAMQNRKIVRANQQLVEASQKEVNASLEQVQVGQEQVRVAQEQVRLGQQQMQQALDARYDAHRPLLIPAGGVEYEGWEGPGRYGHGYKSEARRLSIGLKNAGPGIALDVRGVVFGEEADGMDDRRHVLFLPAPMESGLELPRQHQSKPQYLDWHGESGLGYDCLLGVLGGDTIGEPPQQLYAPIGVTARMTITARDVFGRKHLFMFDLDPQRSEWQMVTIQANVARDLLNLNNNLRECTREAHLSGVRT